MIITALSPRGEGNTKVGDFSLPNPKVWPASEPYNSKHSLGPELITVSAVLTAMSLVTVTARLYTRAVLLGFVGADDYCILLAAACTIAYHISTAIGALAGIGSHRWDLDPRDSYLLAQMYYLSSVFYIAALGLVKVSLLITLRRLSIHRTRMRIVITSVFAISIVFSISNFFVILLQCLPIDYGWKRAQYGVDPGPGKCLDQAKIWYTIVSLNMLMDLMIWVTPMPLVWKMKGISTAKKMGLAMVFSLGGAAVFAAIARLVTLNYSMTHPKSLADPSYHSVSTVFCSVIEVNIAVTASSLLPMRPLWRKVFRSQSHSKCNDQIAAKDGPSLEFNDWRRDNRSLEFEIGGMAQDIDERTSSTEERAIEEGRVTDVAVVGDGMSCSTVIYQETQKNRDDIMGIDQL